MSQAVSVPSTGRFSIVIVGSMNPRIHHPYWYKINNLLTDEEVAQAISGQPLATVQTGQMVVLPEVASFQTAGFSVTCQARTWEVATTDIEMRSRILTLAKDVFDGKLQETPTSLVGLNNDFHIQIAGVAVRRALAARVAKGAFGIDDAAIDVAAAQFSLGGLSPSPVHLQIQPGSALEELIVRVNSNHPFLAAGTSMTYFDIGPTIDEYFEVDFRQAEKYAKLVADTISANKLEGEQDGAFHAASAS